MSNHKESLFNCTAKNTPYFSFNGETFQCKCVSVYDGDTVTVIFDTFGQFFKHRIRLSGIDTPEIRTKNENEKKLGFEVRDFLREKILDKIITIKCGDFDKYGRLLGDLFLDGVNLNKLLVEKKYAYNYDGGAKEDIFKT